MCKSCNSEKEQGNLVTRRSAIKKFLVIAGGALAGLLALYTLKESRGRLGSLLTVSVSRISTKLRFKYVRQLRAQLFCALVECKCTTEGNPGSSSCGGRNNRGK